LKIVIITQARTGSTRLPEKVLLKINGKSILQIHCERLLKSAIADAIVIATTTVDQDILICHEADKIGVPYFRGSENDVLDRYYHAAIAFEANVIVRVTSDCPLNDALLIDEMLHFFLNNDFDYISNAFVYTFPDGLDIEIMNFTSLEYAWKNAKLKSEREHVTPFIRNNSDLGNGNIFKAFNFANTENLSEQCRLTIDEEKDFNMFSNLIGALGIDKGWKEYVTYLKLHPEINNINKHIPINEGYIKSLKND